MTVSPYATADDLTDFLSAADAALVDEAARLLARASEQIDKYVRQPFGTDDNGLPTDDDVAEALKLATCAQVEFWLTVGEDHAKEGQANRQVSIGHLSMTLSPELAPRAATILTNAGLTQIPNGTAADWWLP